MKKTLFFASLIAMVAILATSCQPKGEAPRALFGYSENGLVVTFENLSQNATSYLWDFGDGKTSTEENPVHEYADYGDYTVKLTATNASGSKSYEEELNLIKRAIVVDGDFSDWKALGDKVVTIVSDENDKYDGWLSEAKFARDEDYLYFYLNLSDVQEDFVTTEEGTVHEYYNQHVQFCLNFGDDAVCCNLWYFTTPMLGFIEATWTDQFEGASYFLCDPSAYGTSNDDWLWIDAGVVNFINSCEPVVLGPETNQNILADYPNAKRLGVEGKMSLLKLQNEQVKITNNTIKIGVVVLSSEGSWTETGSLPEDHIELGVGAMVSVPEVE